MTQPRAGMLPPDLTGDVVGTYVDRASGCRIVVARPSAQRRLWRAYLNGARATYRRFGVERVLEYDAVLDGSSTSMFFVALDDHGTVVGGVRVQGPYSEAGQAHALREWGGRRGTAGVRREVTERLSDGVIEMKTGWVDPISVHRHDLSSAIARTPLHALGLLNVRSALCTLGTHAIKRWQSTGGVVSPDVASVPYPDDRYTTMLMWWDSLTFTELAVPDQLPRIIDESVQLLYFSRLTPPEREGPGA